ncbi:protein kinase [Chloroflexota bacterium]
MEQGRIGHYEVLEEIAAGGQGAVYRARDVNLGRIVVLKVLHHHIARDPQFKERFLREARTAASLTHPNVVTIHAVGEEDGQLYMAMEYLPVSLHARIRERGALGVEESLEIARQIARALQAGHERGIVHRDMKPQNVLITDKGLPKVTDFGIARVAEFGTMTAAGAIIGTPQYMSPEQARGERADIRSDIYALGIALYQMLTGELPFTTDTPLAVLRQHIDVESPRVRRVRGDVPQRVDSIVRKRLEKEAAKRYQTPEELEVALERAVAEEEVAPPRLPRKGLVLVATAVGGMALVAVVATILAMRILTPSAYEASARILVQLSLRSTTPSLANEGLSPDLVNILHRDDRYPSKHGSCSRETRL